MSLLLPERRRAAAPATARPVLDLGRREKAGRVALHTDHGPVTYDDLAGRVSRLAARLGPTRRLVLVETANALDPVVGYLAALEHGHVALLAAPEQVAGLVEAWDPDVVLEATGGLTERRDGSAHHLHPDLALLLSTSGSTGSPKLVRLSRDNLTSNAASIASYLGLTPDDRAATSLPLHYCYGLSVLHSHLLTGAGVVLTDRSVVDDGFWERFTAAGATSFAGVPYTFELLEHAGFADRDLPTLRFVTQAGGRMAPDRVRRWAGLGRERGFDLVVMYGQTEATARIAWLPPGLAEKHPAAVGVAVPGGRLRLEPVPDTAHDVGELVYEGPNVMLGYAEHPDDLALGATLAELRTGDLARCRDGLFEIVGRRGRTAKVFGLRLDLERVERRVTETHGDDLACVVADPHGRDLLHAVTTRPRREAVLREAVAAAAGLPAAAVRVTRLAELPRTPAGKPCLAAIGRYVETVAPPPAAGTASLEQQVLADFATVLGRTDVRRDDSFAGLGGDSLSYVELATRLAGRLPALPADWPARTVAELVGVTPPRDAPAGRVRRRRLVPTDTTVVLRAVAILLVVGTHANLLTAPGGAHLLLAVAGYNLARFTLGDVPRRQRVRHGLAAVAQVALPSALVLAVITLATGMYAATTPLFLNELLGSDTWTVDWQFWFLEVLVWLSLGVVALAAVPAFDRWERRAPFAVPLVLLGIALAVRFAWTGVEAGATERYTTGVVAWCFVLGWLAARAATPAQRVLVGALAAVATVGFFGDLQRELVVAGGIAVLVALPTVRVPAPLTRPLTVVAGASLFVYLTHWQVYPHLEDDHPLLATLSSFAVGTACWWLARPALRRLGAGVRRRGTGDP